MNFLVSLNKLTDESLPSIFIAYLDSLSNLLTLGLLFNFQGTDIANIAISLFCFIPDDPDGGE